MDGKTYCSTCNLPSERCRCIHPHETLTPQPQDHVSTQKNLSVQPLWCLALPVQQQSVLLLGARGPDGIAKAHPAKRIQRAYRACVLVAARYGRCLEWAEKADTFMCLSEFSDSAAWTHAVEQFFLHADDLPHHFYMHLIHGAEILGYKHPDDRFRLRWSQFYDQAVKDFHLTPETEVQMDARLSDWERKHWQAPSVSSGVGSTKTDLEEKETDVSAGYASKQKWSPIESAPHDGTVIDLWTGASRYVDCFWGKPDHSCGEAGEYCDSDWHTSEPYWVDGTFSEFLPATPTHWMPRPNGPSEESDRTGADSVSDGGSEHATSVPASPNSPSSLTPLVSVEEGKIIRDFS